MIALFLALSLSFGASPAPTPTPEPTPAFAPVVAQTPDAGPPVFSPTTSDAQVGQLQALFDQSCAQRAYATYDDLCETLKDQIKVAQRAADRTRRAAPATPSDQGRNP